jgi:cytosine/creatinine deaminase
VDSRPSDATVLCGARLADGSRADVVIGDGTVTDVRPPGSLSPPGAVDVDLDGFVLLAAAVEPHAHLDKAFLAETVPNPTGDLVGAIAAMAAARPRLTVTDTAERAERAARLMARNGYRAVRTHADVTTDNGLASIEALSLARRRVADVIEVQIVALTGSPVAGPAGADHRALLAAALDAGADVVGGCPHLEHVFAGASAPGDHTRAATDVLLGIAADAGRAIDLHTDETLDPAVDGLGLLAAIVTASGFAHPVTASHCVSLAMRDERDQRRIAEATAAAGIAVVALPATNLYLQGRDHQQAMPRAVTAVQALRSAGVTVAAGADNLQDPFNPLGRACPFETAALMVLTSHLLPAAAWEAVSSAAAAATGLGAGAIRTGALADLLAVPARTLREAIAFGPGGRIVWRAGERQEGL